MWVKVDEAPVYATDNASSTSWNPWTLNVAAGLIIFVNITVSQTPGTTMPAPSKPGGETNNWVELSSHDPAAGGAGERSRLWGIQTTVAWNHALTFTFGTAKESKVANYTVFSGGSLLPRLSPSDAARKTLPWASAASSIAFTSQSEAREGDLVIGYQTNGSPVDTLDGDATNGVWVDAGNAAGGVVLLPEDIALRMSYKIATGRGTQTLNGTETVGAVVLCPREAAHVITEGGDIDSGTAHPAWLFRTADAGSGPNYAAMTAAELLLGGTMHKQYNTPISTPAGYTKYGAGRTDGTTVNVSTQVNAFSKVSTLADGPKVVVTTTGGLGAGSMVRTRGAVGALSTWETEAVFGADSTVAGTTVDITADGPLTVRPGDKLVWFLSLNNHDPATSAVTIGGLTGCTFTAYEVDFHFFTTDPDGTIQVGYVEIDATPGDAPVSVTPTLTTTYNSGASAAPAAFVRVRYLMPAPDEPFNLECGEASATSLEFTWDTPGGDFEPTYYEVHIDGEAETNVGLVNGHEFTGLDPNTTHELFVRACNESQCGDWVSIMCTTCPDAPINLTATDIEETTFTFCWETP